MALHNEIEFEKKSAITWPATVGFTKKASLMTTTGSVRYFRLICSPGSGSQEGLADLSPEEWI